MFEHDDDDDDDSSEETLSKPVLPIGNDQLGPLDMKKMPSTGEEYLRQVRYQASQLPEFQTASNVNKSVSKQKSSKKHPWHRYFSSSNANLSSNSHQVAIDWQNQQCKSFSDVRDSFFQTRDFRRKMMENRSKLKLKSANDFWQWCFGDEIPFQSSLTTLETPLPTVTKMSALTQFQLQQLLQNEILWLKTSADSIPLSSYMYATLAALEKPIDEDTIFSMRQLCSAWKQIRTELLNSSTPIDPVRISTCNLFVCLIGRYFGQLDLADPDENSS